MLFILTLVIVAFGVDLPIFALVDYHFSQKPIVLVLHCSHISPTSHLTLSWTHLFANL